MSNSQNGWNHQNNDNEPWDKWNSNASHSSYYNQPTHRPYGQIFTVASGVCGLLSVTTCCTGFLSLPLGALGILFAILVYRKGKRLNSACIGGIIASCAGIISAIAMLVYSILSLPALLENEAFRSQFDTVTEQMYGMDFAEFLEEYYGFTIEE